IFFTGCGSTGRLSIQLVSIWRDFWQTQLQSDFENRAFSVMAGGDFALIKSVEGFEDFAAFGEKQIGDLGVSDKDVVFAITEGGETSFVIGTAWRGVEVGAKVYFVYNNPDEVLCRHVQRSREVIEDARIEKINLTTGPMAITGSTRMQATTIQLCVMLTVLEMVARELIHEPSLPATQEREESRREGIFEQAISASSPRPSPLHGGEGVGRRSLGYSSVPQQFLAKLTEMHATLKSAEVLSQLSKIVELEESVYRAGHKNNYYADRFGIDVLTDTTERSPTYCTPPFRKFDDMSAAESWAFLFLPYAESVQAWERILKREPYCVEWDESEVRKLVSEDKFSRTNEIVRKISRAELMRFKIGLDGWEFRPMNIGDSSVGVLSDSEEEWVLANFLNVTSVPDTQSGFIYLGCAQTFEKFQKIAVNWDSDSVSVFVPSPATDFLLDGVTRVGVKMLLNALSTCTMVRLGRVMGNYMIWVVASNLKLIDRATRYIEKLTGMTYEDANRLLFEVVEYVEPRMKADQAYPPVVGLAVMRARHKVGNEAAERLLAGD
ncbi:MAG: hypothetical protein QOD03_483, partial [Verrucomicrobiota bacterium]